MTSTVRFENGIHVVFGIQFYFTTGRVPIARELRFSHPYPTFDGMSLGYKQRGSEDRVRDLLLVNCFTRRQSVRVECSVFKTGSRRCFIGTGF